MLAAALVLRLVAAAALQAERPDRFFFGDSDSYWQLGLEIAHGDPYRYGSDQGWIMRVPGYPAFLSVILRPCLWIWLSLIVINHDGFA